MLGLDSPTIMILVLCVMVVVLAVEVVRLRHQKSAARLRSAAKSSSSRSSARFGRVAIVERQKRLSSMFSVGLQGLYRKQEFAVFVFGPGRPRSGSEQTLRAAVWEKREEVRLALEQSGFFAIYGEDLGDVGGDEVERRLSPALKEKVLAREVQLIIILAEGEGAIAELSELSQVAEVCPKVVIAVHDRHAQGYLRLGPVRQAEALGAKVVYFKDEDLIECSLLTTLYDRTLAACEGYVSRILASKGAGLG